MIINTGDSETELDGKEALKHSTLVERRSNPSSGWISRIPSEISQTFVRFIF
jgi:hypothetical protein